MAANAASGNVEGLSVLPSMDTTTAITFTGQSMGREKYDRIDDIARVCVVLILITWVVLGSSVLIFGRSLLGLYTSNPEVIEIGMVRMRMMIIAYVSAEHHECVSRLTRAMGYSILPMLLYTSRCLPDADRVASHSLCLVSDSGGAVLVLSSDLDIGRDWSVAGFFFCSRIRFESVPHSKK